MGYGVFRCAIKLKESHRHKLGGFLGCIPRFGARSQVDEVADIDRISPHRVQLAVLLSDGIM
jgi:hypothetical protein